MLLRNTCTERDAASYTHYTLPSGTLLLWQHTRDTLILRDSAIHAKHWDSAIHSASEITLTQLIEMQQELPLMWHNNITSQNFTTTSVINVELTQQQQHWYSVENNCWDTIENIHRDSFIIQRFTVRSLEISCTLSWLGSGKYVWTGWSGVLRWITMNL